jgi:cysteinyl-tRNA synthetase
VDALNTDAGRARAAFIAAMDDDFNTAGALAVVYDLVRAINTARDAGVANPGFAEAQAVLKELLGVLGLTLDVKEVQTQEAGPFIELLIKTRLELRKAKQYALADSIRTGLADLGITLEDSPQGTTWRTA